MNIRNEHADITIDLFNDGAIEYHGSRNLPPWRITLAETGLEAMTGCRIKRIQKYVGDESFMLTYGDGVGDVDISTLVDFHKGHGRHTTITTVLPPSRFGRLKVEGDVVTSFEEKPQTEDGIIDGGSFVCEPKGFDYDTADDDCTFERAPLTNLARDRGLMAFRHDGFWMPMDTAREHVILNDIWRSGRAPWGRVEA
jgi:glucose-1-phosphate cytidylyltransferase